MQIGREILVYDASLHHKIKKQQKKQNKRKKPETRFLGIRTVSGFFTLKVIFERLGLILAYELGKALVGQ